MIVPGFLFKKKWKWKSALLISLLGLHPLPETKLRASAPSPKLDPQTFLFFLLPWVPSVPRALTQGDEGTRCLSHSSRYWLHAHGGLTLQCLKRAETSVSAVLASSSLWTLTTRPAVDQSLDYDFMCKYLFTQTSRPTCYELFQGTRLYCISFYMFLIHSAVSCPKDQLKDRRIECGYQPHRSLGVNYIRA